MEINGKEEKEIEEDEDGFELKSKIRKKSFRKREHCFIRNIFDHYGSIYIYEKESKKIFASKIRIVNFSMKKDIFEKGKIQCDISKTVISSSNIPDIKFWYNRYYYFSKFDQGILMDYESWYSVTPEELAKYTAILCKGSIVVDAFCGSGGNVIQFSKFSKYVYAIDIDQTKIDICKNNANVYNCAKNIEFICCDFLQMTGKIKADYIFLSPPWGGVEYKDSEFYSIKEMMTPNIFLILKTCFSIANRIICYFPRTTLLEEFFDIIDDICGKESDGFLFVDIHILNSANKVKAVMLIFDKKNIGFSVKDLRKYLKNNYKLIEENQISTLLNFSTVIGIKRFLKNEFIYKKNHLSSITNKSKVFQLIKFFKENVLNSEENYKSKELEKKQKAKLKEMTNINIKKETKIKLHTHIFFTDDGKILTEEEYKESIANII